MNDLEKEKLVDSRIIICHYCRQLFHDEHKKECWKCNVHHLIRYVFNYEENSYINNNIKEEDTIAYIQELDGLSPFETWPYEHHPLYHKAGIYGIYIDEIRDNRLVYIGKSKNLYVRWLYHTQNIFDEGEESDRKIYEELRNAYIHEHDIIFKVLEFCYIDNEKTLNKMEDEWISKCEPPYNMIIPDGNGGHIKKDYFEYVYYDEYDYYKNEETGDYELRSKYEVARENLYNKMKEEQAKINALKLNQEVERLRNKNKINLN